MEKDMAKYIITAAAQKRIGGQPNTGVGTAIEMSEGFASPYVAMGWLIDPEAEAKAAAEAEAAAAEAAAKEAEEAAAKEAAEKAAAEAEAKAKAEAAAAKKAEKKAAADGAGA